MVNKRKEAQSEIEVVMLEELVPQDHLLRKIDKYIDFSFIRDLTRDLYCHTNGRPDRKSTRLNSSHQPQSRMPSSA